MLPELFIQHPPPWSFSDNREGHEGEVNVYDDSGGIVLLGGDMEDCTMADILLAHAIAALPDLLTSTRELAGELETWLTVLGDPRTVAYSRAANAATAGHAALNKAGIKEEGTR